MMFILAAALVDDMKLKLSHCTRLVAASSLALVFALGMSMPAFAAPPFELDGNATSNDFPGDDWDVVNQTPPGGNPIARTGLIVDLPEPDTGFNQFQTGGSKDQNNIPNWRHTGGSPPDKDDITNAYAAAYRISDADDPRDGHLILVFGIDRFDNSGDAQLGFWFLQDDVRPVAGGTFNGVHVDGDILALVNFSGGGDVPSIEVFQWQGTSLVQVGMPLEVLCTGGFIPSGQNFCGITNVGNVPAPWPYQAKGVGVTTQFPDAAFFEGAIDLTALGLDECFTQFLAESRSSTSITASLQDFATPAEGFSLCNIDVTKNCTNPRLNAAQDAIIYDISGTVTATGNVSNVTLSDNPPADGVFQRVDCADPTTVVGPFPLDSLSSGEVACYSNTITVPLVQNGLSDTVTATAETVTGLVLTDSTTAECPNLQISPALSISKTCTSVVEVIGNQLVVKVDVKANVCNVGDTNLSSVAVTDNHAGALTGPTSLAATDPDTCADYTGSYFPSEAVDANGNPTLDPGLVVFKDTATATATDIFGAPVTQQSDMAECPLCP